jgi:hypothetical protein
MKPRKGKCPTGTGGDRGIALPIFGPGIRTKGGVGGQRHAPAALHREIDQVAALQQTEWALEPVWRGAQNLATTGVPGPDGADNNDSLYRQREHENYRIS